jgi:hypothetical protein
MDLVFITDHFIGVFGPHFRPERKNREYLALPFFCFVPIVRYVGKEISRQAASTASIFMRCVVVMLLAAGGYRAGLLAWTDHLSRSSSLADRERAVRETPDASLYERLAAKVDKEGGDPAPSLARAIELDPAKAEYHMRVGLQAEMAGRFDAAEQSLLTAARLSHLYQPRYLLAQYYFRRQNPEAFFTWAHAAFDMSYNEVTPLLDLCWRMHPDPGWLEAHALSGRREIKRQYLVFLARHKAIEPAEYLAAKLSELPVAADVPSLLEFCDRNLAAGRAARPVQVWNRLCAGHLLPFEELEPAQGVSLTDGNFAHPAVGQAFDWHLNDTDGVISRRMIDKLNVTFSGHQAEWCGIAWQYLAVQKGSTYTLRSKFQGIDLDTPDGLCWKLYDLASQRVPAREGDAESLSFTAPSDVLVLMLSYQRPSGSPRLAGTVAVSQVELRMER